MYIFDSRVIVLVVVASLLVGVGSYMGLNNLARKSTAQTSQVSHASERATRLPVEAMGSSNITFYCDAEAGVQYIVFESFRKGGIAPRIDARGLPVPCGSKTAVPARTGISK